MIQVPNIWVRFSFRLRAEWTTHFADVGRRHNRHHPYSPLWEANEGAQESFYPSSSGPHRHRLAHFPRRNDGTPGRHPWEEASMAGRDELASRAFYPSCASNYETDVVHFQAFMVRVTA